MRNFDLAELKDLTPTAQRTLEPGQSESHQVEAAHWLAVISGTAEVTVEGQPVTLRSGGSILIQAGERHEIRAAGDEQLVTLAYSASPEPFRQ